MQREEKEPIRRKSPTRVGRRPLSLYQIFQREYMPLVRAANLGVSQTQILVTVANMWKNNKEQIQRGEYIPIPTIHFSPRRRSSSPKRRSPLRRSPRRSPKRSP